jgi:hypothetical protein
VHSQLTFVAGQKLLTAQRTTFIMALDRENLLTEAGLRQLMDVAAVRCVTVLGLHGGFMVQIDTAGGVSKPLSTVRGSVRRFATVDTAGIFLKQIGFPKFEVDMTDFLPGRIRSARPDRAAALRNTRTRPTQQNLIQDAYE